MNIRFIKEEALDNLKVNIKSNIDHYGEENNKWIYDFFNNENLFLDFKYNIKDFDLDMSEEIPSKTDLNNIKLIYENLNFLTESQASDERFWAGLTHDKFWSYMKYRWGNNILNNSKGNEDKVQQIKQSYFYGFGKRRSIAWNGIAKLWWIGKFTYNNTLDNPYEITEYVINDLGTTTLYLVSSNFTSNDNIRFGMFKAILEFERKGVKVSRTKLKELMKHINILGGSYLLDFFTEDEIKNKCIEYLDKIIDRKTDIPEKNKLKAFTEKIKTKQHNLTGTQLKVKEYIIDNIQEISNYKNCNELAKRLGVSATTINITLLKMNLGSYGRFIGDVNRLKKQA
ncbi:hypothetical protein GOM49_10400 [Clostridium bovifaecis]|uniref:Uncharacterized protein n=1 Tax=Clostridium bovifaecis TaxID=2184719 RepID=A0A6I6F2L1_9CLOT|nr:hypothetical protein GOM49_10400 [Clostridium bovifaecis]